VALAVLDRDHELVARRPAASERARRALDRHRHVGAEEPLLAVESQHARQEARLAEDLEAVANAEHGTTLAGERADRSHHRREAGDRTAAEVIAVREASGEDDAL